MEDYIVEVRGGSKRRCFKTTCSHCGSEFYQPKYRKSKNTFCSKTCHTASRTNKIELSCALCGITIHKTPSKMLESKSGLYFCSRNCKDKAQRVASGILDVRHYGEGLTTYRDRALAFYGEVCQVCGYSKDVRMLDVDHKDSNRKNAAIENLQVLCVWCHALKTRKVDYHDR